jgi:hypothetical protein
MPSTLEGDRNATIDTNLAGIAAADGSGFKLPEGYYTATVEDAAVQDSKQGNGNKNLVVDVRTTGPTNAGVSRRRWLTLRPDALFFLKGFLSSCGFTPAALEKPLSITAASLIGKTCFIHVIPAKENTGTMPAGTTNTQKSYDEIQFVTKEVYMANASVNGATSSTPAQAEIQSSLR